LELNVNYVHPLQLNARLFHLDLAGMQIKLQRHIKGLWYFQWSQFQKL